MTAPVGPGTAAVSSGLAALGITSVDADGTAATGVHRLSVAAAAATATATAPPALTAGNGQDLTVTLADGTAHTAVLAAWYADVGARRPICAASSAPPCRSPPGTAGDRDAVTAALEALLRRGGRRRGPGPAAVPGDCRRAGARAA